MAERIREDIANHIFEDGKLTLKITISIGVSTCPDNASTVRDLIITADEALYKTKHTGKNKVIFSEVNKNNK